MLENSSNKMQTRDNVKETKEVPVEQSYFFPQLGITVQAKSLDEAQKKAEDLIIKKQ